MSLKVLDRATKLSEGEWNRNLRKSVEIYIYSGLNIERHLCSILLSDFLTTKLLYFAALWLVACMHRS